MLMIIFLIFFTLFLARSSAGYDSRHNKGKYFIITNKIIAGLLLPKKVGKVKRLNADLNKMTYKGAVFYLCNLLVILSIPVFSFIVPEIDSVPFELDVRYLYISVNTVNEKVPVLLTLILLAAEIISEFINIILIAKREKMKGMVVLACVILVITALFGIMMLKELIFCFI